jgi:hypothetical protein
MRVVSCLLVATVSVLVVGCGTGEEPPAEPSDFLRTFDPARLARSCRARFDEVVGMGHRVDVIVTPPGHRLRDFRIEGRIRDGALGEVLDWLRVRLLDLAEKSGVRAGRLEEDVSRRPADVVAVLLGGAEPDPGALRGFWFEYRSDEIRGVAEVLVAEVTVEGETVRVLACAVHESTP